MAKGTKVTKDQERTIHTMNSDRKFYSQIARATGLSIDTIRRHLKHEHINTKTDPKTD